MKNKLIVQSRRSFFRRFFYQTITESTGLLEEFHGRPQMRLQDIDQFPDETLRGMIPVFNLDVQPQLKTKVLLIRDKKTGENMELVQLSHGDFEILKLFNRGLSLENIAERVKPLFPPDGAHAYARVKILFFRLTRSAVCHPKDAHAEYEI